MKLAALAEAGGDGVARSNFTSLAERARVGRAIAGLALDELTGLGLIAAERDGWHLLEASLTGAVGETGGDRRMVER